MVGYLEMPKAHCNRRGLSLSPHGYTSPPSMLGQTLPSLGCPARRDVDPFFFAAPWRTKFGVSGGCARKFTLSRGLLKEEPKLEGAGIIRAPPARPVDAPARLMLLALTRVYCLCLPGTKKMVEGVYEQGAKCLVVEDVVTSGMSVLETTASLKVRYPSPLGDAIFPA
jgi:hypothetical protein